MKWGWTGRPASIEDLARCVGPGWYGIVSRLVDDLLALGWDGSVLQVKEKFGGLRFYIGGGSDTVHDRILAAEEESYKTCEECGGPGILREERFWRLTLCEGCNGK